MSDVICPTCGATGTMQCSTMRGNDHRKRILLEIQQPFSSEPDRAPIYGSRDEDGI